MTHGKGPMDTSIKQLKHLYTTHFSGEVTRVVTLRADGSNREIYRLRSEGGPEVIGVHGPDRRENRAFVRFARELADAGIPVPEVYAVDEENRVYLQEDLGDTTLFRHLTGERELTGEPIPTASAELYREVVRLLPQIQIVGGRRIDYSLSIPRPTFDRRAIMWDLHYFKYLFLRLVDAPFDEDMLQDDLERLAAAAIEEPPEHFMYRDFQSRNIMIRTPSESPWFIDFQGGRRGPLQYDLASLLYDAKADLPEEFRSELLDLYVAEASDLIDLDGDSFRSSFPIFTLLRALQAMGAYGYRGLYQGKEHFIASIPFAVANVTRLIEQNIPVELPELASIFEWLCNLYRPGVDPLDGTESPLEESIGEIRESPVLNVLISSFGFPRGGYPEDRGGHGGGFVFDCRLLDNPGREEEYRRLSGLDPEVVRYLEERPEVDRFFDNVWSTVGPAVDRYLARGFDSLSVSFGCTGGQHRSVYMAERLAGLLRKRYGTQISIDLHHREEEAWRS